MPVVPYICNTDRFLSSTSNAAVINSGGGAVFGDLTAERDINIRMTHFSPRNLHTQVSNSNFLLKI